VVAFKGGSALEKRLSELAAKVSKPANLSVGFLDGATYPDGTSVAMVAALNDFGGPKRPARAFFRNMVADKSPQWGDAIAGLLEANGYDATRTMEQMGAGIDGQLKQSIVDFSGVPLSPKTIAAKGFDKQLVDSGVMLASTGFEVK
jgi:hypothetical protein